MGHCVSCCNGEGGIGVPPGAKAETEGSFEGDAVASKEPSAEEPTSEKSSGCVAS